jgi:hypothetical protein
MGALRNPSHEAFCLEYMKDHNATAAYKRAGYSPKSDKVASSTTPHVRHTRHAQSVMVLASPSMSEKKPPTCKRMAGGYIIE